MPEKFYLTTPIYYVNARPHIGHAYTTLAADTIARRHRLLGHDTFFLTGTDEHGQKIERSAAAAGIPPQQFADEVSASFEGLWKRLGITNDAFIRTTSEAHKRGAQKLFADLHAAGHIYLSSYTGQYSIGEEMFVEGPPGTIGPDGKPTETVTEENFFFRLSDFQLPLIDLIESGTLKIEPEARRNEVLSFLRGGLRDLSVSRSSFTWGIPVPEPAASETKQSHVIYVWLDALANYMTALGYGSDMPDDLAHFSKYWPADLHLVGKEIIRFHCVYWPAFLLALNPKLRRRAGEPVPTVSSEEHREWAKQWLPKAITAHGWLLFDDAKMSKSKGNIVRTETILDAFGEHVYKKQFPDSTKEEQDLFATDVLRYFLLREIPFGQDGSFSFDALITRYNADLANGYGNLVSRTLTMISKSHCPQVPDGSADERKLPDHAKNYFLGFLSGPARTLPRHEDGDSFKIGVTVGTLEEGVAHYFERTAFAYLLENILWAIAGTDSYLTTNAPWKMAESTVKDNILLTAAESIRLVTALLHPVLPYSTGKVWKQLGLGAIEDAAKNGEIANLQWGGLKPGTKLGPLAPIFPRADKGLAQIMIDMEAAHAAGKAAPATSPLTDEKAPTTSEQHDTNDPAAGPRTAAFSDSASGAPSGLPVGGSHALTTERPVTPTHAEAPASGPFAADALATAAPDTPQIAIDDFVKIDLRVAKIVVAERIPKADKLLRLEVDLGYERRQILSGIAEWYTPEELLGRRIVIIANLAPRKMRGLESHGMLLAASSGDHSKPILTTFPDTEDLALGSRVR